MVCSKLEIELLYSLLVRMVVYLLQLISHTNSKRNIVLYDRLQMTVRRTRFSLQIAYYYRSIYKYHRVSLNSL